MYWLDRSSSMRILACVRVSMTGGETEQWRNVGGKGEGGRAGTRGLQDSWADPSLQAASGSATGKLLRCSSAPVVFVWTRPGVTVAFRGVASWMFQECHHWLPTEASYGRREAEARPTNVLWRFKGLLNTSESFPGPWQSSVFRAVGR